MIVSPCTILGEYSGSLYECEDAGDYTRVCTPMLYPDGDSVHVYCRSVGTSFIVTDLGETMNWLSSNTISTAFGARQMKLIEDTIELHDVEFIKSNIHIRCQGGIALADAINRVSQASARVSDVSFTFRTRNIVSTADEVSEFLSQEHYSFERDVDHSGYSRKKHNFHFETQNEGNGALVLVLACGSRGATSGLVQRSVSTWYDMKKTDYERKSFVSLFDDTLDVWSDSDFAFLESISNVARWSDPATLKDRLKTA